MCWRFPCFILNLDAFGQPPRRGHHQHSRALIGGRRRGRGAGGGIDGRPWIKLLGMFSRQAAVTLICSTYDGCFRLPNASLRWVYSAPPERSEPKQNPYEFPPVVSMSPLLLFCLHVTVTFRDRLACTNPPPPPCMHRRKLALKLSSNRKELTECGITLTKDDYRAFFLQVEASMSSHDSGRKQISHKLFRVKTN